MVEKRKRNPSNGAQVLRDEDVPPEKRLRNSEPADETILEGTIERGNIQSHFPQVQPESYRLPNSLISPDQRQQDKQPESSTPT
jgi:hypothetical protein